MKKIVYVVSLIVLTMAVDLYAEAPNLLTYQGRLKEGGQAVSGNRMIDIQLCDDETVGNCYSSGEQSVTVSNGLFRSTFTVPVTALIGTGNWYLKIAVGGVPLTPRERLTSSAYSLFAATAAYASNITAGAGSDGVYISSNLYVTGNAFSVGGSTLIVVNGKVGIGTMTPVQALDVSGFVAASSGYNVGGVTVVDALQGILAGNGSASVPGYRFSAQGSMGMFRVGLNTLGFSTNSSERLRIDGSGNVGIGTVNPAYRLVVSSGAGEAGNLVVISTGTSDVIRMTGAGGIYANKYYGDGSQLQGVTATGISDGSVTKAKLAQDGCADGEIFKLSAGAWVCGTDNTGFGGTLSVANGGTGLTTIAAGNLIYASALDTYAAAPITAAGRALIDDADAAAQRTTLGLVIGTNVQAYDSDLTTYAGITPSANMQSLLGSADYAAARTNLSLAVGTNVQAWDTDLDALAANNGSALTGITKAMVGLDSVDNTSDVDKPVSSAQSTALDLKANIASPTFTGTVTGITSAMVGAVAKAGDTMTGQLTNTSSVTITGNSGGYGLQVSSNVSLAGILYSANGNVGIGTTGPIYKLEISGGLRANAGLFISAGDAIVLNSVGGNIRFSVASGVNQIYTAGSDLALMPGGTGKVGVGITVPDQKLTVAGNISQTGVLISSGTGNTYFAGNIGIGTASPADKLQVAGGITASSATFNSTSDVGLRVSSSAYLATGGGNVGIGTASPGAKLEVSGQVKITGGTPGEGKVLTSDASGLAGWQASAGGVPAGAVMFFNLVACPSGWTALSGAQGRYLVGLPAGGTLSGTSGTALSDLESRATGQHNHDINDPGHAHTLTTTGTGGGATVFAFQTSNSQSFAIPSNTTGIGILNTGTTPGTNAPYIQLLVCSKD